MTMTTTAKTTTTASQCAVAAAAEAAAAAATIDNNNTKAMAHVYYSISLQDYVVTKADDLNANEQHHSKCLCVYTYKYNVITQATH